MQPSASHREVAQCSLKVYIDWAMSVALQVQSANADRAELADAGRRLLAKAELEARQGAGYHRPLAKRGEDLQEPDAGDRAQSAASECMLLLPAKRQVVSAGCDIALPLLQATVETAGMQPLGSTIAKFCTEHVVGDHRGMCAAITCCRRCGAASTGAPSVGE
jgi:hypothetical protein